MASNALRQPFLDHCQPAAGSNQAIGNWTRPVARFQASSPPSSEPFGNVIYVDFAPPEWRMAIRRQFAQIRAYRAGWDGPNSAPIDDHILALAGHALEQALMGLADVPQPAVVPCADGGLQIEWCVPEGHFEMYFYTDGDVSAWLKDETGLEHEADGAEARDLLRHWAARLGRTITRLAF